MKRVRAMLLEALRREAITVGKSIEIMEMILRQEARELGATDPPEDTIRAMAKVWVEKALRIVEGAGQ